MKRLILLAAAVLLLAGCGIKAPETAARTLPSAEPAAVFDDTDRAGNARQEETVQEGSNMIRLTIGENTILAELYDNDTAGELAELLKDGPIAMSARNYGGFEKVCNLGTGLTARDTQITTRAGDIMLYHGNQIVIFYDSNTWDYTGLARVREEDIPRLRTVLSGEEDTVTIALD